MKFFKVGPPMQVSSGNCHEINVVRHDFREFAAIVLGPGVREGLRQLAGGLFVFLGLGV